MVTESRTFSALLLEASSDMTCYSLNFQSYVSSRMLRSQSSLERRGTVVPVQKVDAALFCFSRCDRRAVHWKEAKAVRSVADQISRKVSFSYAPSGLPRFSHTLQKK